MFTNKFKATVSVGAGVIIAGALVTNQAIQQKQISVLQDESMNQRQVEKIVVATPTATPTATLTPTIVPAYRLKVVTPTKGVARP